MGVDTKGRGDAEVVVGLHDLGAKADGVKRCNDLFPTRTGMDAVSARGGVGFKEAIVEGNGVAIRWDCVAAPWNDAQRRC